MKIIVFIASLLLMAGCAKEPPPQPIYITKLVTPDVPVECTEDKSRLAWINPKPGFEPTEETARRERLNKNRHEDALSASAVCASGFPAGKAQPQGKKNG